MGQVGIKNGKSLQCGDGSCKIKLMGNKDFAGTSLDSISPSCVCGWDRPNLFGLFFCIDEVVGE